MTKGGYVKVGRCGILLLHGLIKQKLLQELLQNCFYNVATKSCFMNCYKKYLHKLPKVASRVVTKLIQLSCYYKELLHELLQEESTRVACRVA